MNNSDSLREAKDLAEIAVEKTELGKLRWSIIGKQSEEAEAFQVAFGIGYIMALAKDKSTCTFSIRELSGLRVLSENAEVNSEYGYDSISEKMFAETLGRLYLLIRKQVYDVDKKLEQARDFLKKL